MKKTLFCAVLAASFAFSGCTKKRQDEFSQGQGINLQNKASFDTEVFTLKTGKVIAKAPVTAAETREIEGEVAGINHFDYVEWESDAELLNIKEGIPFRGRPDSKYEIRYLLSDKYLKVVKVAEQKDIPYEEWSYMTEYDTQKGATRYAVPLVGYDLKWVRAENSLNADKEKTNTIIEIPVNTQAEATHFKIDRNSGKIFDAVEKMDVYPVDYFTEGEWYFSVFFDSTSPGDKNFSGYSCTYNGWMAPNWKVKIQKGPKALVGKSLNIAKEDDLGRYSDKNNWFTLPVEYIQTRTARDGSEAALKEEDNSEIRDMDKKFVKVDFGAITTACRPKRYRSTKDKGASTEVAVKNLQLSEDYFAFTVNDDRIRSTVTYSFWRKPKGFDLSYESKNFHEKDYKYFGSVFTMGETKGRHHNYVTNRQLRKTFKLARFNPKKPVIWYLTSSSPKERFVREMARLSVKYWQDAFREAGTGMSIQFIDPLHRCPNEKDPSMVEACWDSSKTKAAGDIRFNTINFIDDQNADDSGILFGLGPMRTDVETGQTISAHSQIYYGNAKAHAYSRLRRLLKIQLGQFNQAILNLNPFHLGTSVHSVSPLAMSGSSSAEPLMQWDPPSLAEILDPNAKGNEGLVERPLVPFKTFSWDKQNPRKIVEGEIPQPQRDEERDQVEREFPALAAALNQAHHHANRTLNGDTLFAEKVKSLCPHLTKEALKKNHPDGQVSEEEERQLLTPCVSKVLNDSILFTTVHELGHNFGLFHNFSASADKNNFFTPEDVKRIYGIELKAHEIPRSSSVMEYQNTDRDRQLIVPGPYDIAALRYIYSTCSDGSTNCSKVQKKGSNEYFEVPNGTSIDEHLASTDEFAKKSSELGAGDRKTIDRIIHRYAYCQTSSKDVFCNTRDSGVTSTEIVSNYIDDYRTNLALATKRFDRAKVSTDQASSRLSFYLVPIKRHYDHWRMRLHEVLNGQIKDSKYLSGLEAADYQTIISDIKAGKYQHLEKYEGEFDDLLKMRQMAFDFMVDVALLPNMFCILKTADGYDAVEFEKVREDLKHTGATIKSCQDPLVKKELGKDGRQVVGEVGLPMHSFRYSLDDRDVDVLDGANVDVVGVATDRLMATLLLSARAPMYQRQLEVGLIPNFLDEPDFRERFFAKIKNRILNGQQLDFLKSDGTIEPIRIQKFHYESDVLPTLARLYTQGLVVPGNLIETFRRMEPFSSFASQNQFWVRQSPMATQESGIAFVTQSLRANHARDIIRRHKFLNEIATNPALRAPINKDLVNQAMAMIMPHIPANDEQISYEQLLSIGQTLNLLLEGDGFIQIIRKDPKAWGIDPEKETEEQINEKLLDLILPARWFLTDLFNWEMLVFNGVLSTEINGNRVGMTEETLKALDESAKLAEQMKGQWKSLQEEYLKKLRELNPVIERGNEVNAALSPLKEQAEVLEAKLVAAKEQLPKIETRLQELFKLHETPEGCAEGDETSNCQNPNQEEIDKLTALKKSLETEIVKNNEELAQINEQMEPLVAEMEQINDKLAEQPVVDIYKMYVETLEKLMATNNEANAAEGLRAQFEQALNQAKSANFAPTFANNKLPMKTLENFGLEKVADLVDRTNQEIEWARDAQGLKEKEAQQNMLIKFLLSLSGGIRF